MSTNAFSVLRSTLKLSSKTYPQLNTAITKYHHVQYSFHCISYYHDFYKFQRLFLIKNVARVAIKFALSRKNLYCEPSAGLNTKLNFCIYCCLATQAPSHEPQCSWLTYMSISFWVPSSNKDGRNDELFFVQFAFCKK